MVTKDGAESSICRKGGHPFASPQLISVAPKWLKAAGSRNMLVFDGVLTHDAHFDTAEMSQSNDEDANPARQLDPS